MIKDIRYKFEEYEVSLNGEKFDLKEVGSCDRNQKILLNAMLNFGETEFEDGMLALTARNIVNFWNYASDTILKDYSVNKYYQLLNLPEPYSEKVPTIKTSGAFHSNDFKMTVCWIAKDTGIVSSPIAYEQRGLKLRDLEYQDTIGSIYPEYFELYYMIDRANEHWKEWKNSEKYNFLEELEKHSEKREFILPKNLAELLNKHKGE